MRKIKFRAWYKPTKVMGEPETIQDMTSYTPSLDIDDRFILMQYTGLKDKNGKEIYEGDIIQKNPVHFYGNPTTHEILFKNCGFCLEEKYFEAVALSKYIRNRQAKNFEVIGNIYENPELLKSNVKQT